MIETATGLVLRTRALTETSLIVHWLTRDSGRLATVAKGARRPNSPFRGKLDICYLCDFSFSRSRRSELHLLREVSLHETHPALRRELACLQQAAYCASLIEDTTETDTPLPGLFEMLLGFLAALPLHPPQPQSILAFELKLLRELGLAPDLSEARLTPGAKAVANALGEADWESATHILPTAGQLAELRRFLHGFLIYHLGKLTRGRDAALGA